MGIPLWGISTAGPDPASVPSSLTCAKSLVLYLADKETLGNTTEAGRLGMKGAGQPHLVPLRNPVKRSLNCELWQMEAPFLALVL